MKRNKFTDEEKQRRRDEIEQVDKLSIFNKSILITIVVVVIFKIINSVLMHYFPGYSMYILTTILNFKNGFLFKVFSYVPYYSYLRMFILFVLLFMCIVNNIYQDYRFKVKVEVRNKNVNRFFSVIFILLLLNLINNLDFIYNLRLPNFDTILFSETKDKIYTKEELLDLNYYLKDVLVKYADSIKRDSENKIILDEEYIDIVTSDLKNISNSIPLLKGLYPDKSYNVNKYIKYLHGNNIAGLTANYSTYFDYNNNALTIINTMEHEFCHTKGILRENEATFCSILAGIESDREVSRYSGYLEAFSRANYALYKINPEEADKLEDDLVSMCLLNNYFELCDIYTKNNTEYFPNADNIVIMSYYLKHYENYKDELFNSLLILKDNGAKFLLGNDEVDIEQINNAIDNKEDKKLIIVLKNSKKTFKNIKEAISNNNLYLAIYQRNKEITEDPLEKEDPVKYFLYPFKKDELIINMNNYADKYAYERSARYVLEYFDSIGYKEIS